MAPLSLPFPFPLPLSSDERSVCCVSDERLAALNSRGGEGEEMRNEEDGEDGEDCSFSSQHGGETTKAVRYEFLP